MKLQSIIVKKPITKQRAIAVAKRVHPIKKIDEKTTSYRFRISAPRFNKYVTKKINKKISLVLGVTN